MSDNKNILKEAILRDPELGESKWNVMVEKAKSNLFTSRYCQLLLKEGILSDMAGALGKMYDVVIDAAKPALIGREIIWVMPTTEAMVRFPRAKLGKAKRTAELSETWIHPEKKDTVDITPDIEIRAGAEWTKKYIEDANWNVMERQVAEVGRACGQLETDRIIALYGAIAAGDLAGGAVQSPATGGTFAWADLVKLWNVIKDENFNANVVALHPDQVADLWNDDKFIHSFYFGQQADVQRGVLGQSYLGMKIVSSTLLTAGTVYAVDTTIAAAMILRRDILTEPFENPRKDRYGIVASERIGLGALRTKAVAKMTGA